MMRFKIDSVSAFAFGIAVACLAIWYLAGPCAEAAVGPKIILSDGWVKGPMKPGTWGFGGVVMKDHSIHGGFYFADFRGSHVIALSSDGRTQKILLPDEVGYYNATLHPPSHSIRFR
jgi:hypothetical protein